MSNVQKASYISVDAEELQRRRAQDAEDAKRAKGRDGKRMPAVWMTIGDGEIRRVRVMPPWTAEGINAYVPWLYYTKHWQLGPSGKGHHICPYKMSLEFNNRLKKMPLKRKNDLGLETMEVQHCYTCEQNYHLKNSGHPRDKELADDQYAGNNWAYQVIDIDNPVWLEKDPEIAELPELIGQPKLYFLRLPKEGKLQANAVIDDVGEYGFVTDPYQGTALIIERTGTGKDTQWGVKVVGANSGACNAPLFRNQDGSPNETMIAAALNLMVNMDDHPFFRVPSFEETQAIYLGEEFDRSGGSGGGGSSSLGQGKPNGGALTAGQPQTGGYGNTQSQARQPQAAHQVPQYGGSVQQASHPQSNTVAMPPQSLHGTFAGIPDPFLKEFIKNAETGRIVPLQQLADENGWGDAKDTSVAKCYETAPDHAHPDCRECPVQPFCSKTFHAKTGRYSISQPAQAAPPTALAMPTGRRTSMPIPPPPSEDDIPF